MKDNIETTLRIPIPQLAVGTVSLPLCAFLSCIYLSIRNDHTLATSTHCGVSIL